MDNLNQLERHASELTKTVATLVRHFRSDCGRETAVDRALFDPSQSDEVDRARKGILSHLATIKAMVCGPIDLLESLSCQNEVLACLKWLGSHQILACIPRSGSVLIKDLADLANVSGSQLRRIIRMLATEGFLKEDPPDYVSHTKLSDPFFSNPLLLDAAMFMAEHAAPAALNMAVTDPGAAHSVDERTNGLDCNQSMTFLAECERRPKLGRQHSAYLQYAAGLDVLDTFTDTLTQLKWPAKSYTCVVEVGAQSISIARSLAALYPSRLRFIVQLTEPSSKATLLSKRGSPLAPNQDIDSRITVVARSLGAKQPNTEGDVYILHLPSHRPQIAMTELQLHLGILRRTKSIAIIPTAQLLPEPGTVSYPRVEAVARSRDLGMLQLVNEREMELTELLEIVDQVRDDSGKLIVTKRLHSSDDLVVALVVKYQVQDSEIGLWGSN